jgi:hypothetical protein
VRCACGTKVPPAVFAGGDDPSANWINRGLINICAEGKLAISGSLSPVGHLRSLMSGGSDTRDVARRRLTQAIEAESNFRD